MKKKWLQVTMACCLSAAMLLAGCGSSGGSESDSAAAPAENAGEEAAAADGKDPVLFDGVDTELDVVFVGSNSAPASLAEVEAAITDIVSQYMDAHVKLQIIEWGAYTDQYNLMLSSGENVDLMWAIRSVNYATKGQLTDITDLVPVYAPEALDVVSAYVDACYVDGALYGLPTFHDLAKADGIVMRKDIVDELGIDVDALKTWDDVGEMLAVVKEAYPNMNVLVPGTTGMLNGMEAGIFDALENIGVGVTYSATEAKVENLFATEEYRELCQRAYDWNQKGYFLPDAATNTETRQNHVAAGNTFGYVVGTIYPGVITQESNNCGMEMVGVTIDEATMTTSNAKLSQWVVPTSCEAPEKAVALMNLLYTNADVQNLFFYGIEGKDYEIKDAEKGQIGYPDGVTTENVGWQNEIWVTGNAAIAYTWETNDPDIWNQMEEFNNNAKHSSIYGFVYNTANVANEITAITNVISKYNPILESGAVDDVDGTIEKFVSELEAAGIQNVIDDMQAQIDAWKAQ